jgi:hypothetical protein
VSLGNVFDIADKLDSGLNDHPLAVIKKVYTPSHLNRFGTQFLTGKTE